MMVQISDIKIFAGQLNIFKWFPSNSNIDKYLPKSAYEIIDIKRKFCLN